jgi:hypothetical protein
MIKNIFSVLVRIVQQAIAGLALGLLGGLISGASLGFLGGFIAELIEPSIMAGPVGRAKMWAFDSLFIGLEMGVHIGMAIGVTAGFLNSKPRSIFPWVFCATVGAGLAALSQLGISINALTFALIGSAIGGIVGRYFNSVPSGEDGSSQFPWMSLAGYALVLVWSMMGTSSGLLQEWVIY